VERFVDGVKRQWEAGHLTDEMKATVLNCFLYDCATMMALSCMHESTKKEVASKRMSDFALAAGVSSAMVAEIVALAKEERALLVEKYRSLEEENTQSPAGYSSPWSSVDFM
jgi:hypothetical protein